LLKKVNNDVSFFETRNTSIVAGDYNASLAFYQFISEKEYFPIQDHMMKYLLGWRNGMTMTTEITKEMLSEYEDLNELKKDVEKKLEELKKSFHLYFDGIVGENEKGEVTIDGYKLQRQIRRVEKFDETKTVDRLESLNLVDLVKIIKKPDEEKIKAALNLGFLTDDNLDGCISVHTSGAIYIKPNKE
jgi:hypothetical protein